MEGREWYACNQLNPAFNLLVANPCRLDPMLPLNMHSARASGTSKQCILAPLSPPLSHSLANLFMSADVRICQHCNPAPAIDNLYSSHFDQPSEPSDYLLF